MLREVLLFNLLLCPFVISKRRHKEKDPGSVEELGSSLISTLRDDKNLDLSMDEEYEDLRAELLAYHTALSSLTGPRADDPAAEGADVAAAVPNTRRSLKTTPCWKLGGICVKRNLCKPEFTVKRFMTEVPGCKSNQNVCCFSWNRYQTADFRDKGIQNRAFPWSRGQPIGGRGLIGPLDELETSHEDEPPVYNIPVEFSHFDKKKLKHYKSKRNRPVLVIVKPNNQ